MTKNLLASSLVVLSTLAASQAAIADWTKPRLLGATGGELTDIAAAGELVHVIWYCGSSEKMWICYSRSADCGETWSEPRQLFESQGQGVAKLSAKNDRVHLVWDDAPGKRPHVYQSYSLDGGLKWSKSRMLSREERWSLAPTIDVFDDEIYVAFVQGAKGPKRNVRRPRVVLAVSLDGGRSWTLKNATPRIRRLRVPLIALGPSVKSSGPRIHLAWEQGQQEIFYQVSDDRGADWSDLIGTATDRFPGHENVNPQALQTAGGGVHILWTGSGGEGFVVLYNGSEHGLFREPSQTFGKKDDDISFALHGDLAASNDVLHVVWQDERGSLPSQDLGAFVSRSYDRGMIWSEPKKLISRTLVRRPAIAASDATAGFCRGSSHVIYQDFSSDRGIVYRRRPRNLD